MVASRGWSRINFDVSTAFLQGKGDGRQLGIKAPEKLKLALKMGPTHQRQLDGGAYGRIDAPFLWFQTFKETLEKLGFIQSPFDACTFALISQLPERQTKVHGVLGIQVDDGMGGGNEHFISPKPSSNGVAFTVLARMTQGNSLLQRSTCGNGTTGALRWIRSDIWKRLSR